MRCDGQRWRYLLRTVWGDESFKALRQQEKTCLRKAASNMGVLLTAHRRADTLQMAAAVATLPGNPPQIFYPRCLTLGCAGGSHAASKGKSNGGIQFTLRFSYIPALGIVAVCPPPNYPSSLLANLFPNDTGRDTPNPTNHHGRAARASPLGVFEYPGDVPCRPYRWAQWLSGLHFPPPAFSFEATAGSGEGAGGSRKAIEPSVSAVVAELRSRVRTQWALASQLKAIGDKGPVCLAEFHDKLPLGKASANNVELRR